MLRQHVDSSNINEIGYDKVSQILEIEFLSGSVYQYFNVPEHVYEALMMANSYGKYFSQNIKNNYQYAKIS